MSTTRSWYIVQFQYETAPRSSCAWICHPQLLMLFEKMENSLGHDAELQEVGAQRRGLTPPYFQPKISLLPNLLHTTELPPWDKASATTFSASQRDRIPRLSIKINPLSEFCQVFCHHEERVNASPVFKEPLTIISFTIIGSQVLFICNYRQLFSGHGLLYKLLCRYFTQ